jgi:LysM repeat protein
VTTSTSTRTTTASNSSNNSGTARPARPAQAAAVRQGARHTGRAARQAGCPAVARAPRPAVVRPAAPAPAAPAGTHLTARGRAVVLVVLVALLLAAFSLGRTVAEGSTAVQSGAAVEQVTVLPGDTLWAVASRLAPGQDPRPVVEQIRRLNDLPGGGLQAGQQLLLPVAP